MPFVGDEFIPIRISIRGSNSTQKDQNILSYKNMKFFIFRAELSELLDIPYEKQLILLMASDGQGPVHINNLPENDEKELKDLKITDNSDIVVNFIEDASTEVEEIQVNQTDKNKRDQEKEKEDVFLASQTGNLVSVLLTAADDQDGVIRYYADLSWTLGELIDNIKKKLNIDTSLLRRLRRLNGNTLFYEEELSLALKQLNFEDGGIRLSLERGKIPKYGNLTVNVKNQSNYKKEEKSKDTEFICFPNETVGDL